MGNIASSDALEALSRPKGDANTGVSIAAANNCGPNCKIGVSKDLSLSEVTLTRDILGKVKIPDEKPNGMWIRRPGNGGIYWIKKDSQVRNHLIGCENGKCPKFPNFSGCDDRVFITVDDAGADSYKDGPNFECSMMETPEFVNIYNPASEASMKLNASMYSSLTKCFLLPTAPFQVSYTNTRGGTTSDTISIMSIYHPFPVRIESVQYDAVLQIGELCPNAIPGGRNKLVFLIPIVQTNTSDKGSEVINKIANQLPALLNSQPDPLMGYPSIPGQPGATWKISDLLRDNRSFFTSTHPDGTKLIIMQKPLGISPGDLANIMRLPITKPTEAIPDLFPFTYRAYLDPDDAESCKAAAPKPAIPETPSPPGRTRKTPAQIQLEQRNQANMETAQTIAWSIFGGIVILLGVWAAAYVVDWKSLDTILKSMGESLGRMAAGGLKQARSGIAGPLGFGSKTTAETGLARMKLGKTARQTAKDIDTSGRYAVGKLSNLNPMKWWGKTQRNRNRMSIADYKELEKQGKQGEIVPIEPEGTFSFGHAAFPTKGDFTTEKSGKTRKTGLTLRTLPGLTLPQVFPEPTSGDFEMTAPAFKNLGDFKKFQTRTRRNIPTGMTIRTPPIPTAGPSLPAPSESIEMITNPMFRSDPKTRKTGMTVRTPPPPSAVLPEPVEAVEMITNPMLAMKDRSKTRRASVRGANYVAIFKRMLGEVAKLQKPQPGSSKEMQEKRGVLAKEFERRLAQTRQAFELANPGMTISHVGEIVPMPALAAVTPAQQIQIEKEMKNLMSPEERAKGLFKRAINRRKMNKLLPSSLGLDTKEAEKQLTRARSTVASLRRSGQTPEASVVNELRARQIESASERVKNDIVAAQVNPVISSVVAPPPVPKVKQAIVGQMKQQAVLAKGVRKSTPTNPLVSSFQDESTLNRVSSMANPLFARAAPAPPPPAASTLGTAENPWNAQQRMFLGLPPLTPSQKLQGRKLGMKLGGKRKKVRQQRIKTGRHT